LVDPGTPKDRQSNAATVEVLLDTVWRVAAAEQARRESINGKASSLVAFCAVVVSITAPLGGNLIERVDARWALALFALSLLTLVSAVGVAIFVLLPRESLTFSIDHLRLLPSRGSVAKPPNQVRGETMQGLVAMIERERAINHRNARGTFVAFALLFLGLLLVTSQAVAVTVVGLT
jgi:hypothetical protein